MGIEPTLVAWEATVLPLNYTRVALDRAKVYAAPRAVPSASYHSHPYATPPPKCPKLTLPKSTPLRRIDATSAALSFAPAA